MWRIIVADRSYLKKCVESPTIKCLGKETLISTADGISQLLMGGEAASVKK